MRSGTAIFWRERQYRNGTARGGTCAVRTNPPDEVYKHSTRKGGERPTGKGG